MSHKSLTKKGYVIKKKHITHEEERQIVKDLSFQPLVMAAFAELSRPKRFYTFLESQYRFYLPRYYGIEKYGPPETNTLVTLPEKNNFEIFWGLLPHQEKSWEVIKHQFVEKQSGGILCLPCGFGKCLGKNTPVIMFDGSIKMVQNIKQNEFLMGDDNTSRRILNICQGKERMYRILPTYGDSYVVNESHILSLKYNKNSPFIGDVVDIPIKQYLELKRIDHPLIKCLSGYRVPINFSKNERNQKLQKLGKIIDQWGSIKNMYTIQISIDHKSDYLDQFIKTELFYIRSLGFNVIHKDNGTYELISSQYVRFNEIPANKLNMTLMINGHSDLDYHYSLTHINIKLEQEYDDYYGFEIDGNHRFLLGDFQVTHNTSLAIRLSSFLKVKTLVIVHKEFLLKQWQSVIEECTNAKVGIIQRNKVDVEGKDIVIGMLQSIAMKDYPEHTFKGFGLVMIDECFPSEQEIITSQGTMTISKLYQLWSNNQTLPLIASFNQSTKKYEYQEITYAWERSKPNQLIEMIFDNAIQVKCTPNHQFLTQRGWLSAQDIHLDDQVAYFDGNINKSSYLSLSSTKLIKNNDLILVYDLEINQNHNFVVTSGGKLDSGVVAHNCHHIASETFSKALPKIACHYTLGLSATPIRKDGLTQVFLNYLGPIFHKERRHGQNQVWIKYLEIKSQSEHFDLQIMKHTGTKDTGKMITNISQYEALNYLIIEICRLLVDTKPRKVIVLGARRDQLEWLSERWNELSYKNSENKFATGGLYYGNQRMNKKMYWKMLDVSAKCDIIWGTNEIAKEGLDIKDLNTMILLNGGQDVEQAVGRILRKFHKKVPPTVIDVVYKCGNFPKHANVRKDYYSSEGYVMHKMIMNIDDRDSVYTQTDKLQKFLEHYPEAGATGTMKPSKKALKAITLANRPSNMDLPASNSIGNTGLNLNNITKKKLTLIPIDKKVKINNTWSDQEDDPSKIGEKNKLYLDDSDNEYEPTQELSITQFHEDTQNNPDETKLSTTANKIDSIPIKIEKTKLSLTSNKKNSIPIKIEKTKLTSNKINSIPIKIEKTKLSNKIDSIPIKIEKTKLSLTSNKIEKIKKKSAGSISFNNHKEYTKGGTVFNCTTKKKNNNTTSFSCH